MGEKLNGNIVLIGFMGVGKGRTARELASMTKRIAVDTDDLIESMTKKKIRKLFSEQGEKSFRRIEQRVATWLEKNVSNTIVSTGGGFYMVNNIKKLGHVIYLHSSVESIIEEIKKHPNSAKKIKKRPLLQNLKEAKLLYKKRVPLYRNAATHEVLVEGRSIKDVAKEIISLVG